VVWGWGRGSWAGPLLSPRPHPEGGGVEVKLTLSLTGGGG